MNSVLPHFGTWTEFDSFYAHFIPNYYYYYLISSHFTLIRDKAAGGSAEGGGIFTQCVSSLYEISDSERE